MEDETNVPAYTLPELLLKEDGTPVKDVQVWRAQRRPEIVRLYEEHVYGKCPAPPPLHFEGLSVDTNALGGKAVRKQVSICLTADRSGPKVDLLIYLPRTHAKPVPAFLGLNFNGNQTVNSDPGIWISSKWIPNGKDIGVVSNRATEASRGVRSSRWPVQMILDRGYAMATAYCGDMEPDFAQGWKMGIRSALSSQGTNTVFKPDDWGALAAWGWGLSRALDYLEQDPEIDARHVAVIGHSRLGKTALWAGARDERFAMVISNDSGEGGAALSRRCFGERIHHLIKSFPHWFCPRYNDYAGRESALPVDAHMLIALMAPRPVYVASASQDLWADPKGEFLAAKNAEPVYQLYGLEGLGVTEWPAPDHPVGKTIGYHLRSGAHDITAYDWQQYLDFADRHFKGVTSSGHAGSGQTP